MNRSSPVGIWWSVAALVVGTMVGGCGGSTDPTRRGDGGARDGSGGGTGGRDGSGGGGGAGGDARGDGAAPGRQQMLVSTSNARGMVRVGESDMPAAMQAEILVIDAETQRPLEGVVAEAVADDGNNGFLVRLSREVGTYRPELVRCSRGQQRTVPIGPDTADVSARAVRVNQRVFDEDFLGEVDLSGVTMLADRENRPEIVFVPALDPGAGDGAMMTGTKFAVYRSTLPRTLLALRIDGARPADGVPVRGQARVVSTSGARRAGARVQPAQVGGVAERRMGEEMPAPLVSALSVQPPDATGAATVSWNVDDPMGRLYAFDVGVDSVDPDKRVAKDVRQLAVNVQRGEHFACVRPVFDGADTDPQVRCVAFDAPMAPPAPNLRVAVRVSDSSAAAVPARRPTPVDVEIENSGDVDAQPFQVDVVVSRDGRAEGGLGEVRTILVDGVKARSKIMRRTEVSAPRDGAFYLVAMADPLKQLREANGEDNADRKSLLVSPAGMNRAPVLSVGGNAVGSSGGGTVARGQPLKLRGTASDMEDGDLSQKITWWSSRDGRIGEGATLEAANLAPGTHRIRAQVEDLGRLAAPPSGGGRRGARLQQAAPEPPESASADLQIEVVDMSAPANSAPAISAGPDLTMTLGGESSPAATARDADNDPLTFAWTAVLAGAAGAAPQPQPSSLMDADKLRARFKPMVAGLYRLTFTVSDGKATEKDEVQVTVLPQSANRLPKVMVMLPPAAQVGMLVRAQVMALDEDMDGLTLSYGLQSPPGSATVIEGGETRAPGFVPDRPGPYLLRVRADDGRGGLAWAEATTMATGTIFPDGGAADGGIGPPPPPDGGGPPPFPDGGMPPPPGDGGPPPGTGCDPFAPAACGPSMGCFLRGPGDVTGCGPAGSGAAGAPCTGDDQCAAGNQCFNGTCRRICDASRGDSCPTDFPVCVLPPENRRLGFCDKQQPPMGCDPLRQTGCPLGTACYGPETRGGTGGTSTSCAPPGGIDEDGFCEFNAACKPGLACMDGPDGRRCRQYCDPAAPACPANRMCVTHGGPIGVCMPPGGTFDGGPPPPPTDGGGSPPCDPVRQSGCSQQAEACYVEFGNFYQCMIPGTRGPDQPCGPPNDCGRGLGCFDGPNGRLCRTYCDVRSPTCPAPSPQCSPLPGSYPWGVCLPPPPDGGMPPPFDGGMPMSSCDPITQMGCQRPEDGCYVVDVEKAGRACLLFGAGPSGASCADHNKCQKFTGCHGGFCRRYCDPVNPQCPPDAINCQVLGAGPYHICVP